MPHTFGVETSGVGGGGGTTSETVVGESWEVGGGVGSGGVKA